MTGTSNKRPHEYRPKNVNLVIYSLMFLIFAFLLIIPLGFSKDSNYHKYQDYSKLPKYEAYKSASENTRVVPINLPVDTVPKEYTFDFSKENTYFLVSDWVGLQQTPEGIKLGYKSRPGTKAYVPYNSSGSFVLDDLKLTNIGIIYAVEIDYDASVPEGTSISFKVNGNPYTGLAFLGKTNTASITVELNSEKDYLTPFLKSINVTLYPLKSVQINPIILQAAGNSVQANLQTYITYYEFAYPNLTYSTDGKAGCNVTGAILTCNNLLEGTFYENLTITDKITNLKASAPIQIVVNSNSPSFVNLPTIEVQEDSPIAPLNLLPYIQDPNNSVSDLVVSIDYIAPASGIDCSLNSKILSCTLKPNVYGNFSIMLKVEDPQGNSSMDDVFIKVTNINDAPSWEVIPAYSLEAGQSLSINLANFVSDIDTPASSLGFSIKSKENMQCNLSTSQINCTPTKTPLSTTLVVEVSDGEFTVEKSIPVSWAVPNQAPIFSGTIIGKTSTTANLSYSLDLSKYFSDPEGSNLSYNYQILSGSAICNISNAELSCNLTSQGYSDVKVSASDGEKSTYSNVFRLAKVSPIDLTATVDVPHTVPLDYTVYFQVYVTNNLSIYLEGVEVTASSPELIIYDGSPVGHTTVTEVLSKLEPNSTVESEFHTTVGGTEKTYNIMLMLNGQQLDSKQIETKNIFYSAGNNLISVWQDQGDNDGAGYWGTGMQGSIPKDNKLKIRVHITSLYDVPLNDLNLCYVSQNGLLKPMSNGQTLTLNVFCQLVTIPALDELVIEQEVMPIVLGSEQQNFILGKGAVQYGSPANLIGGTDMTDFKVVTLSEGLSATWDELPDDSVLSKNTTYNLNVYLINYFAVPIYNVTACMRLVELNPSPTFSFTENSYIKVVGQGCKTYSNTPYASGPGSNELGIGNTQQYIIKTKNLSTSYVGVGIVAGANQDIVLGGKPYSIQ